MSVTKERPDVLEKLAVQNFEKKNSSVETNGSVDYDVVADKFADHFSKAYTSDIFSNLIVTVTEKIG